ncbi:MAG: Flp family type IVb pilin [Rhodospirillales bacterium]|nr:Flp family type IVb pilin [Rhodospirillales bacterium]
MSGAGAPFSAFSGCSSGATAIEYALIGAGISIVIVAAVLLIGDALEEMFNAVVAAF